MVNVSFREQSINHDIDLEVSTDNATWVVVASDRNSLTNVSDLIQCFSVIVPDDHYYRVSSDAGTPTIWAWAELR